MSSKIEEKVTQLAEPIAQEFNLELVDVTYSKEGSNYYLRVFIDKEGGISISDCEMVSRKLDKLLDEHDPVKTQYILEVSSPGLDRALRKASDFEKYKDRKVDLKLYKAVDKVKEFNGTLLGLEDETISIMVDEVVLKFAQKDVAIVKLAVEF